MKTEAAHMTHLLHCLHQHTQPKGGLAFPHVWAQLQPDYTPASIGRIVKLLQQIRRQTAVSSEKLTATPAGRNFIQTLAAYMGSYLSRETDTALQWQTDGTLIFGNVHSNPVKTICDVLDGTRTDIDWSQTIWRILSQNPDTDKSKLRRLILGNYLAALPVPAGLAYQEQLDQLNLDGSEHSLILIDELLESIGAEFRNQPEALHSWCINDHTRRNFLLLVGFYIGETVAALLGKTLIWRNAQALAEQQSSTVSTDFFDSIAAELDHGLLIPVLRIVEQAMSNTNISVHGWLEYLRGQTTTHPPTEDPDINTLSRHAIHSVVGGYSHDNQPEYHVFRQNELTAGNLDYSLTSLEHIDHILAQIRSEHPDFTRFATAADTQNFLHFCTFYMVRTAAELSGNALKWLNYNEAHALIPELPRIFPNMYAALIGDHLYLPLEHICAQIWNNNADDSTGTAAFARELMQHHAGKLYQHAPDAKQNTPHPPMPDNHRAAFLATGFGLAWALHEHSKYNPNTLMPPMLIHTTHNGTTGVTKLIGDAAQAVATGRQRMQHSPTKLPHQILIYESYANLPHGRFDALAVETAVYEYGRLYTLFTLLPFIRNENRLLLGKLTLNGGSASKEKAPSILDTVYEGMDSFSAPADGINKAWWRAFYHPQL